MSLTEQLKKGKFWSSGNAHNRARGFKGGTIKQGQSLFVKRLSAILDKFKVKVSRVKPAVLWVDTTGLSVVTRRQLAAVVLRELQPSVVELVAGRKLLYAWWD